MKKLLFILVILALCAVLAAGGELALARVQNARLDVTEYALSPDGLPAAFDGFTIAQISDYHGDAACRAQLLDALRARTPDLIAITGDLTDPDRVEESLSLARALAEIAPTYYVTGNHEARLEEDFPRLLSGLRDAGVTVLRDESILLERGDARITVSGMDDPEFRTGIDLAALCDPDGFTLLLAHRPELFAEYVRAGADLVLAGHAHGGQFRIPGSWQGVYAPAEGFFPQYTQGVHTEGRTTMVVSRGLANLYFPPRLFNAPELVLVTLHGE